MGRICIVRGCREPRANSKITLFAVPKDPILFDAWKSNLLEVKKPFSASSYVCEKHFHPSDLITHYIQKLPTHIWSYPYGKKRLKPNAVPSSSNICVTSGNNNLSHKEPIKSNVDVPNKTKVDVPIKKNVNVPIKRKVNVPTKTNVDVPIKTNTDVPIKTKVDVPTATNDDVPMKTINDVLIEENINVSNETNDVDIGSNSDSSIESSSANTVHVSAQTVNNKDQDNKQHNNCEAPFTFDTLLMDLNNLKYPGSCNWTYILTPDKEKVVFLSMSDDNVLRRVEIYDDLSSRILLEFILVHDDYLHHEFKSTNEVVDYLITIYNWNLCATLINSKRIISNTVCGGIASCKKQNIGRPALRCTNCNEYRKSQKWQKPPPTYTVVKKVLEKRSCNRR
ncbi:uncharacterized protein LOC122855228 [Aphidius gifuensis]|uniref:uncharacterized protein LOC122855228 n=1 Tax=Aphidius gifuensis TaxID=684658 RepID=UPI001CDCE33C|nr:uncharacterized protein LOC122855228 [Aphidius gifuensis]